MAADISTTQDRCAARDRTPANDAACRESQPGLSRLRERDAVDRHAGTPGDWPRLIQLLDSPDEAIREAARSGLAEFSFDRFLVEFDRLDESLQATTGTLVKRVDQTALRQLAAEFNSPSAARQRRAVDMAIAMDAVNEMEPEITALGESPDHTVRLAAVGAMSCCNTRRTRTALEGLLTDRSAVVREAAEGVLQTFASRQSEASELPAA